MTEEEWHAGFGKADITVFEPGMCMFGWGQPQNVAQGVAAPLHARAFVLHHPATGRRIVYVCADLGFISLHLRQLVLDRLAALGIGDDELMLTATHTHSGPNGYSAYLFYTVTGPGFSKRVAEGLAEGIACAVRDAILRCTPARIIVHEGHVPLVEPVAFNRSLAAYNANCDVEPISAGRHDEAIDRRMVVLRVENLDGQPRGLLSWFAVHGTSVHSDNTSIHPDNKGVAAEHCEREMRATLGPTAEPFVAIFAQEAAGDVSPNYRWCESRRMMIGHCDDDLESADFAGVIQARTALALFHEAKYSGQAVCGPLEGRLRYSDFSRVAVDPEFAAGVEGRTTSVACLGLGFAFGTPEGPGPAFGAREINPAVSRLTALRRRWRRPDDWRALHGPKMRFVDLGHGDAGHLLTWLPTNPPGVGLLPDNRVRYYNRVLRDGHMHNRPWVPHMLPVQLIRIGPLCIVGVPVEPTTVSGRRMRAAVLSALAQHGVERVIINGYANAYASYVTTHEEYQLQRYEGASTLFGQWTLGAFCTKLRALARDLVTPQNFGDRDADYGRSESPPHYGHQPLLP